MYTIQTHSIFFFPYFVSYARDFPSKYAPDYHQYESSCMIPQASSSTLIQHPYQHQILHLTFSISTNIAHYAFVFMTLSLSISTSPPTFLIMRPPSMSFSLSHFSHHASSSASHFYSIGEHIRLHYRRQQPQLLRLLRPLEKFGTNLFCA